MLFSVFTQQYPEWHCFLSFVLILYLRGHYVLGKSCWLGLCMACGYASVSEYLFTVGAIHLHEELFRTQRIVVDGAPHLRDIL